MDRQPTIIEAGKLPPLSLGELWRYRSLLLMLAWRNIVVRYKQTFLGVMWVLAQPLATMIAFSVIFGRIAKLGGIAGVPYPLVVFSGVLAWQFFSSIVTGGGESLLANRRFLTKIYFPRVILPLFGVLVNTVDLLLGAAVFFIFYFVKCPECASWRLLLLPLAYIPLILCGAGVGMGISALSVRYRDLRNAVPFLLRIGLFVSPVGFAASAIPASWHAAAMLNPIYGAIGAIRWMCFGAPVEPLALALSAAESLAVFLIGLWLFRANEKDFADYI